MEELDWVDNHCHIPPGAEGQSWVDAARSAGVSTMVTVGVTTERSAEAIEIASQYDGVYATVGVHPHDSTEGIEGIRPLVNGEGVVAIGEAGLDYFYDHSERDIQRRVFAEHIALATEHDLPLVIHSRDAWEDTFAILDSVGVPRRTVFHCFTGGPAEAERALERNIVISVSGIVTFKNAVELQKAVLATPLEHLMIETDLPYLAPVPKRGKKNEPANVVYVGEKVADLLGCDIAEVASSTARRARQFYSLTK